jgi:hypothetical protein
MSDDDEILRWYRNGKPMSVDPPFLVGPDTDEERAANLVAALLHAAVVGIGGLPGGKVLVGDDVDDVLRTIVG